MTIPPDGHQYIDIGNNLALHGEFSLDGRSPSARRELLYPLVIATLVTVGVMDASNEYDQYLPLFIFQFAAFYLALLYFAGVLRNVFKSEIVAGIAMVMGSLPYFSRFSGSILSESLSFSLLLFVFSFCFMYFSSSKNKYAYLMAGCLALLGILKSVYIPLSIPLVFLLIKKNFGLKRCILFVAISLSLPILWTVRNVVTFDALILSTTDGASSIYRGNALNGAQIPDLADPLMPQDVVRKIATMDHQPDIDKYLLSLTVNRIKNEFGLFVKQLGYKAYMLVFGDVGRLYKLIKIGLLSAFCYVLFFVRLDTIRYKLFTLLFASYVFVLYTLIYTVQRYFIPVYLLMTPFVGIVVLRLLYIFRFRAHS